MYMIRARKQTNPHIMNRPRKLVNSSWSTSNFVPWELHALLINHLSCILCSSPLSDSFKIAVDISAANGESRGKACDKI
ncbi:hypothetical protein Hanom_Chr14g01293811 [Helianthus anomalus]